MLKITFRVSLEGVLAMLKAARLPKLPEYGRRLSSRSFGNVDSTYLIENKTKHTEQGCQNPLTSFSGCQNHLRRDVNISPQLLFALTSPLNPHFPFICFQ